MRSLSEFYDSTPSLKEKYDELIGDYGQPSKVYLLENYVKNTDHEGKPLPDTNAFAFVYNDFHDRQTTLYTHRKSNTKDWEKEGNPIIPLEYLYRASIGGSPGMITEYAGHIRQFGQLLDFTPSGPIPTSSVFTIPQCPKVHLYELITYEDRVEGAKLLDLQLASEGFFFIKLRVPEEEKELMSRWIPDHGMAFEIS